MKIKDRIFIDGEEVDAETFRVEEIVFNRRLKPINKTNISDYPESNQTE